MSENNENITEINDNNLTEEQRLAKINKLKKLLEESDTVTFLTPIEKLYVMGNLCALKDKQACQNFSEATLELKRLAEQEDNQIAKDMLKQLGIWAEKPKKKE